MGAGLIFDLDGTLVDSLPGIAASLNHSLASAGFPVHLENRVRDFIGDGSFELARRALPAGETDATIRRIEQGFKSHYATNWPDGTRPYAGISDLLGSLRDSGSRIAVLSNKPHDFTVEIVRRFFPDVAFDEILGQREATPRKPDPTAALNIADLWNTPASQCVFIGDSTVDLETATRAGMLFVGVGWGYHDSSVLKAAGAGKLAESPADLARFLEAV